MTKNLTRYHRLTPALFGDLSDEMGRLFDGFFDSEDRVVVSSPRTNIAELEGGYEVTVDLPGVSSEEFDVEFKDGQLWITGERKHESEEEGKTYHRVERSYGKFRRVIGLGTEVDAEKISAEHKNGVLTIHLPKLEQVRPKRIEVKS